MPQVLHETGGVKPRKILPENSAAEKESPRPLKLALLAKNRLGYQNLCQLLTKAHAEAPKGQSGLDASWLEPHAAGLIAIVPASRRSGSDPELLALVQVIKECLGRSSWLGAFRYRDGWDRQREQSLLALNRRFGLPVLASTRPLMHERSRKSLADVLCCIRQRTTLDAAGTLISANAEARLRGELEMERLFTDHLDWVHRTGEVASDFEFDFRAIQYHFPCSLEAGESADEKLARLCWVGAQRRYPVGVPESVKAQIESELRIIAQLEMAPYFLSTWEIVEMARKRRILCQGRGSAANSAVCFVLGITAVDPARSKLLFERFMSAERSEPPDIDIDFEHERREEVIQCIYSEYGRERAAMVSEVICYRGRSALREVAKVFGVGSAQLERLSETISQWDSANVSPARLVEYGFDPGDQRLKKVIEVASALRGFPRHLSIHVGGFVLSRRPLYEVAPVEPARMPGRTVIPWDKDDLDALGFFKVDVLGLGMLTAIRKTLESLAIEEGGQLGEEHGSDVYRNGEESRWTEPDPIELLAQVPPEDPCVYEAVSKADTVGVFQIESRAQMSMLPRLRPRCFYDLVIQVAIVRPGPIQGGMVHPFLRRRNGQELVDYPHPELVPILERTLGIPLFQEQVMQIAIVGAGYTGGEADQLRRDMAAWKKTGRLLRHRSRLMRGFARKGIQYRFGEALFEQIKGFGEYGFPESHAASFALLVYASAWLKVHHPAHFLCGMLNSQPMGFYSPSSLVRDAQRHGVVVRDVDVQISHWDSTLESESKGVRLGMRLIKGLGRNAAERIVVARKLGPFTNIVELEKRAKLNQRALELLAEAGALEGLVRGRRQALWATREPRLHGLFSGRRTGEPVVRLPALSEVQQLWLDYGSKGLCLSDHPVRHLRRELRQRGVLQASSLSWVEPGSVVKIAGVVLSRQQPATASGIVFLTLEDETGVCNLIVHRRVVEEYRREVRHAPLLLAHGKLEKQAVAPDATAVIHLLVQRLEWLQVPDAPTPPKMSRDFH